MVDSSFLSFFLSFSSQASSSRVTKAHHRSLRNPLMAGRGCSITVYVNPGANATTALVFGESTPVGPPQVHDNGMIGWVMPLFVALHTPLEVLRGQLEQQSGIVPEEQVLILCDLSDLDRNNDILLDSQYDHLSLYDCHIREGSILSLHPVGQGNIQACKSECDLQSREIEHEESATSETYVVSSAVTAAQADHSYNGIIFDMEARGPFEIDILSISIGGMLGRVVCCWQNFRP